MSQTILHVDKTVLLDIVTKLAQEIDAWSEVSGQPQRFHKKWEMFLKLQAEINEPDPFKLVGHQNLVEKLEQNKSTQEVKQMAYKEINPSVWNYSKDGDFIEGVYVSVQEEVGPNKSMLYSVKTPDKGVLNVWGSTILDQRMVVLPVNSKVKITFMGLSKQTQKGHSPAKIFKVEVDED